MALSKKDEKKVSEKVFGWLSIVVGLLLITVGLLSWKAGEKVVSTVNKALVEEKIYFPPTGSPGFDPSAFPAAQKYAGLQVNDGPRAKAFAEDYLGVQFKLLSGGKTLSEVSAQVATNPTNVQLQQLQGALFQISTSKSLLLANGYGAWTQGTLVSNIGLAALGGGAVLLLVGGAEFMRYKKSR